jgi:hypothetical protein
MNQQLPQFIHQRKNAAQYRAVSGSDIVDISPALVPNGAGSVGNVTSRLGIPCNGHRCSCCAIALNLARISDMESIEG